MGITDNTDNTLEGPIPGGERLFQIKEADLAALEHTLPELLDRMYPHLDNRTRTQWRRVQEIVRNVRWNYGPPGECVEIPA